MPRQKLSRLLIYIISFICGIKTFIMRLSDGSGFDAVQPLKIVSLSLAGYVIITHFRPLA